jgi:hypothetical protein
MSPRRYAGFMSTRPSRRGWHCFDDGTVRGADKGAGLDNLRKDRQPLKIWKF